MDKGGPAPAGDMVEKILVVRSKMGIHARPAAMIVRLTSKFKGEVWFEKDQEQVNGKSIMGLMMLAAGHGSKIRVTVQGPEGAQLAQQLEELFERKFDES